MGEIKVYLEILGEENDMMDIFLHIEGTDIYLTNTGYLEERIEKVYSDDTHLIYIGDL